MSEIEASEGAAGNISVFIGWEIDPRRIFPAAETIELPDALPEMAGGAFLVSGSGRRLREFIQDPAANLGFVRVDPGGQTGTLYTSPRRLFARLTSEFNSHLAVHRDQVQRTGTNFHTVIHAQPPHLVYLSHVPRYQDEAYLNRHLLRWQPETIVNLPQGLGVVPFALPGSPELMSATVESLRTHRVVLWCKHGVMARSDQSVKRGIRPRRVCGDRRALRVHEPAQQRDGRGAVRRGGSHDLRGVRREAEHLLTRNEICDGSTSMSYHVPEKQVRDAYALAQERYGALGVDTDAALEKLATVSISLHCWQGGRRGRLRGAGRRLRRRHGRDGQLSRQGAHRRRAAQRPGQAYGLIPGRHRLNLHAIYAETGGRQVERNELQPEHFAAGSTGPRPTATAWTSTRPCSRTRWPRAA